MCGTVLVLLLLYYGTKVNKNVNCINMFEVYREHVQIYKVNIDFKHFQGAQILLFHLYIFECHISHVSAVVKRSFLQFISGLFLSGICLGQ